MISSPSPPPVQAPPPPPNPPMFGSQAQKATGQRQAGMNQGFGATVLGTGNPSNTGFKTLLGQ